MASFINGDTDHVTFEEYSMHTSTLWPDEEDDIDVEDDVLLNHFKTPPVSDNYLHTKLRSVNNDYYSDFVTDDDE